MRRVGGFARIAAFLTLIPLVLAACGGGTSTGAGTTPTAAPKAAAVTVGIVTDIGGLNDGGFKAASTSFPMQATKRLERSLVSLTWSFSRRRSATLNTPKTSTQRHSRQIWSLA